MCVEQNPLGRAEVGGAEGRGPEVAKSWREWGTRAARGLGAWAGQPFCAICGVPRCVLETPRAL